MKNSIFNTYNENKHPLGIITEGKPWDEYSMYKLALSHAIRSLENLTMLNIHDLSTINLAYDRLLEVLDMIGVAQDHLTRWDRFH